MTQDTSSSDVSGDSAGRSTAGAALAGEQVSGARQWAYYGLDLVWVMFFVVMGRSTHTEPLSFGGVVRTATPFVVGAAAARLIPVVRRMPRSIAAGAVVASTTVVVGMVLRSVVFSDGIAVSFIVVTTSFMFAGFVGWRWISRMISAT